MSSREQKQQGVKSWTWSQQCEIRLLDWLDQHPLERNIIFSDKTKDNGSENPLTKTECYYKAAVDVFSVDEDPKTREKAKIGVGISPQGPHSPESRIGDTVRLHLNGQWRKKYQAMNDQIIRAKPNLRLENISRLVETEVQLYARVLPTDATVIRDSGQATRNKGYPLTSVIWDRLHIHWRRLPYYNTYYKKLKPEASRDRLPKTRAPGPSIAITTRRKAKLLSEIKVKGKAESVEIITIDSESEDSSERVKPQKSLKRKHAEIGSESKAAIAKINNVPFEDLTTDQKHEHRMAELQLEIKKLENDALEKKAAADLRRLELEIEERKRIAEHENQRAREKHELRMKMMEK